MTYWKWANLYVIVLKNIWVTWSTYLISIQELLTRSSQNIHYIFLTILGLLPSRLQPKVKSQNWLFIDIWHYYKCKNILTNYG
jgi:hypothetical protein